MGSNTSHRSVSPHNMNSRARSSSAVADVGNVKDDYRDRPPDVKRSRGGKGDDMTSSSRDSGRDSRGGGRSGGPGGHGPRDNRKRERPVDGPASMTGNNNTAGANSGDIGVGMKRPGSREDISSSRDIGDRGDGPSEAKRSRGGKGDPSDGRDIRGSGRSGSSGGGSTLTAGKGGGKGDQHHRSNRGGKGRDVGIRRTR